MENIKKAFTDLVDINHIYGLSVEHIDKLQEEISDAKVCTPVIGKFSSGKSALVNTLLGYSRKILKEDITPETAVPAEIVYNNEDDCVRLYQNSENYEVIEVEDYRRMETDANTITHVRIELQNSFLKEIPDVMIVDMPGFESGFEIHNKAIDDYLPKSLVYIVAFPADDLVVRSSVGNILKELVLNEMPVCVVVTKCDKCNDEFEETLDNLKENLKKYIGDREIHICLTSSFEGNADEVREFLFHIQEQSQDILTRKFRAGVLSELDNTERYLNTMLQKSEMSESELDEEEDKINRQLNGLEDRYSKEKADFELQISEIVEEIKMDVEEALEQEEATFVTMVMNKQDINDHLNSIVRNTVTKSVNSRLQPKIKRYLERVEKNMSGENIGAVHASFHLDESNTDNSITTSIVAVTAGFVLGIPVLGILAAGVIAWLNKQKADKKREEMRNEIHMKLRSEIYPQIMKEVEHGLQIAVTEQVKLINISIEEELERQRNTLEKAMSDVRMKLADEKDKKEREAAGIQDYLLQIAQLRELVLES